MSQTSKIRHYIFIYSCGLVTIILINSLTQFFAFSTLHGIVQSETRMDTLRYNQTILLAISILAPIAGGIVIGYLSKETAWKHGAILGVLIKLFSIIVISTVFLNPGFFFGERMPSQRAYNIALLNILRQILSAPITIGLIALSAWIGETLSKKMFFKKITEGKT